jgi:hypothetical protein
MASLLAVVFTIDWWLDLTSVFRVALALIAIAAALFLSGARAALASLRL